MITWNTDNDLQKRIALIIQGKMEQIVARLRKGVPVDDLESDVNRLNLISSASPYWKPDDFPAVRTYLKLFE